MTQKFWIVDTFSIRAFGGVPSAVFFVDEFGRDDLLQNIAMEINTPETIFVKRECNGAVEAKCYTPNYGGMHFGNSVFAAAKVILSKDSIKETTITCDGITYEAVMCSDGKITIGFANEPLEKVSTPINMSSTLGGVIIVSIAKCGRELIVEIRSPGKLANLSINMDILRTMNYDSIVVTTDAHYSGDVGYDFCANVYAPKLGIFRDITTPVASVALAEYWHERMNKRELVGVQISATKCGQTTARREPDITHVTGNCMIVMSGEMLITPESTDCKDIELKTSTGP
ncbi:MAG: PhzF family phenazine biosynthesis protein [Holosporales bacterium]|jgi:PhzF family phenazine biosynthesis protein|nr:PhzF family phenazine biosynthesis protein [Holosporales bacterium]